MKRQGKPLSNANWFQRNKKTLALLTMVAPVAIWLLLLRYLPMGGIVLAFKNYKMTVPTQRYTVR